MFVIGKSPVINSLRTRRHLHSNPFAKIENILEITKKNSEKVHQSVKKGYRPSDS